jgi:hypothetical protein
MRVVLSQDDDDAFRHFALPKKKTKKTRSWELRSYLLWAFVAFSSP